MSNKPIRRGDRYTSKTEGEIFSTITWGIVSLSTYQSHCDNSHTEYCVIPTSGKKFSRKAILGGILLLFLKVVRSFMKSAHLFVSSSRRLVSSIRRLASYGFDPSLTTSVSRCLSFCCFVVSSGLHHFTASSLHVFWRFGSSSQRGYNLTCLTWNVTWFHALIRDPSLHNWVSAKLQHRIRLESSGWWFSWKSKWNWISSYTP